MRSLEEIDHSIADCKRRVKEQHRRISDTVRRGDDATASAVLLETFTQFLAVLEYRRETLLLLAGMSSDVAAPSEPLILGLAASKPNLGIIVGESSRAGRSRTIR